MYERRWPVITAAIVGLVVVALLGWAAGRSSAPSDAAEARAGHEDGGAIRIVEGVPVGVEHSRAGALAAADNYVARAAETIVQDPPTFTRLIRTVWVSAAQPEALANGKRSRRQAPDAVANYEAGGRALAVTAARKLESYNGSRATVLTWGAGFIWGPDKRPTQRWFVGRVKLVWQDDQWSVEALDELTTAAPTPYRVIIGKPGADSAEVFDDVLDGMSAPIYGTGEAP